MAIEITLQCVGEVRAPFADEADVERDWAEVESEIHIDDEFAPGLAGLEQFRDIVVTFFLHKFQFDPAAELVRRPSPGAAPAGIFALRTYHRPNALGTTTVRLLEVRGRVLRVKGLDALDGSPVLDIRPNVPPPPRRALDLPDVLPEI